MNIIISLTCMKHSDQGKFVWASTSPTHNYSVQCRHRLARLCQEDSAQHHTLKHLKIQTCLEIKCRLVNLPKLSQWSSQFFPK